MIRGASAGVLVLAWALASTPLLTACTRPNQAYEGTGDAGDGDGTGDRTTEPADGAEATEAGSVDGDSGSSDPCATDNGGCHDAATCDLDDDGVVCTCNPGFAGDGLGCEPEAFLRVELPCLGDAEGCGDPICDMGSASMSAVLEGDPETHYAVTLHVRGVVERKVYPGGTFHGWYNEGGEPGGTYNTFGLEVAEPFATYYLNARESGLAFSCEAVDELLVVEVRGGSGISLFADSSDGCGIENVGPEDVPIVIPEIPPAPEPFEGQLMQVDVVEVAPAK